FVGDFAPFVSLHGIEMLVWLGLIPTALAYLAYAFGLASVQASTASTLILAEPATATLLAALILHESLNQRSLYGIAIIACGLIYLAREKTPLKQ
ncbi:MAG: EamA family transporter, partial [Actinobacteria bacterium]|nr:EamA family transporter [Actinomycetota bacterium]